ncbi:class I SAM-dependent methyltransferase [Bradyrhizobium lablabi]|uniref:class I SAM-dependent methyltransferase n=1 Tax=Bradyrhizobium lablabi TaxID=722472 RepID=UPI001BAE51F7|nr:class I SAM-dependent methyltransferase [Bradyrhizobium lablabi]MBR1122309.1 class I SAM-dependent methyltransferase [Bradyrhizobium lablabi]
MFRTVNDARFWDRTARKYAADPIADMAGYERTLERTRHYLKGDESAFEFGCGTGTTALRLAPSVGRIVATDISSEMIAIARERAKAEGRDNATFEVARPEAASWPDGAFDVAFAFNVVHLVAEREAALRGVHRLLRPGGLFISKTPCLKEMNPLIGIAIPLMQLVGKAPYVASFSAEDLQRDIAAAGFEIIELARHASRGRDVRPFVVARKR